MQSGGGKALLIAVGLGLGSGWRLPHIQGRVEEVPQELARQPKEWSLVEDDLELALHDALVEPGAAEHEPAEPVDERALGRAGRSPQQSLMCSPSAECGSMTSPFTARFTRSSRSSSPSGPPTKPSLTAACSTRSVKSRSLKVKRAPRIRARSPSPTRSFRVAWCPCSAGRPGRSSRPGVGILGPIPSRPGADATRLAASAERIAARACLAGREPTGGACWSWRTTRPPGLPRSTTSRPTASAWPAPAARGGPAGDRGAPAGLVVLDLTPRGRQRARAARPGARSRRPGLADRPRPAGDRADRPGRDADRVRGFAARGRRPRLQAVPLRRVARRACAPCCGARRGAAARACCGSATCVDPVTRACVWPASPSTSRRRSSRCSTRWPRTPRGVRQAGAAARRLGLPVVGQHADPRRPRLPPAQEAATRRRAPGS